MASFRFSAATFPNGVQMVPGVLAGLFEYDDFSASSTSVRFFDNARNFGAFGGIGLTYEILGGQVVGVTGGTITSFRSQVGGQASITVTGLSVSAPGFANALLQGNATAAWNLLLGGNDDIAGTARTDRLDGRGGNDRLAAAGGVDVLLGGSGNDTLLGGTGADVLTGGSGHDTFVFNTALGGTQRDVITDFAAADDVIKLDNAVFTAFTGLGAIVQSRFHVGVSAADTGDRIIYDRAEGVLSYDRDGRGGAAAVVFALVDPGTALGYQDIVIV